MRKILPILIMGLMASCGPAQNVEMQLGHDDFVKNYGNNAIACHMPLIKNDVIFCKYTTRFAHHTLTFTEIKREGAQNYKLQYKLRFDAKNNLSCVNYASINDEKIKIFQSKNNYAEVTDDDILLNGVAREKFAQDLLNKYSKMPETCGKYILFTSTEPKMMYKIRYVQVVDNIETYDKNQPNIVSIFSSGTKLEFAE